MLHCNIFFDLFSKSCTSVFFHLDSLIHCRLTFVIRFFFIQKYIMTQPSTSELRDQQASMLTEVLDPIDVAQLAAQQELDDILAAHRLKMLPETHPDFDGESCVSCGNAIVAGRLKLGKIRCTACQSKKEHWETMHPGRRFAD
jgi:RNA polymerase-binding transcription factor DksA